MCPVQQWRQKKKYEFCLHFMMNQRQCFFGLFFVLIISHIGTQTDLSAHTNGLRYKTRPKTNKMYKRPDFSMWPEQ